jgi:hypothetical protein
MLKRSGTGSRATTRLSQGRRLVEDWIAEAADRPQAAPSTPIDEMSNQPAYEVRWAKVPGTDVEVFYRHTYKTGIVNLFWVGPPGSAGGQPHR